MFDKLMKRPALLLRLAIALCYIALGFFMSIKSNLFDNAKMQYIFAGALFLYGGFRLYRTYMDLQNSEDA